MKKFSIVLILISVIAIVAFQFQPVKQNAKMVVASIEKADHINKDSLTIKSRVNVPKGFKRLVYDKGSFQDYLRNYKLKAFGSKIINYDDTDYFWQGGHIGILEIPVPSTDCSNVQTL